MRPAPIVRPGLAQRQNSARFAISGSIGADKILDMVAKEAVICGMSWKEKTDVRLDGVGRV